MNDVVTIEKRNSSYLHDSSKEYNICMTNNKKLPTNVPSRDNKSYVPVQLDDMGEVLTLWLNMIGKAAVCIS